MSSSLAGAGRSMLRGGLASGVTGTTSAPEESAADRNPFVLPSDEDVFRLREVERKRKDDVRAISRILEPQAMSQAHSRKQNNRTDLARDLFLILSPPPETTTLPHAGSNRQPRQKDLGED